MKNHGPSFQRRPLLFYGPKRCKGSVLMQHIDVPESYSLQQPQLKIQRSRRILIMHIIQYFLAVFRPAQRLYIPAVLVLEEPGDGFGLLCDEVRDPKTSPRL